MNMTLVTFDPDKNWLTKQQAKLSHLTDVNVYSFASADCR